MTTIVLADELQAFTGGVRQLEIEATTYRKAIAELQQRFPGLSPEVFARFSIAIDGSIVHTPLLETFAPDSEVVFIPRIASG
jgi:sulfur-carrier protein